MRALRHLLIWSLCAGFGLLAQDPPSTAPQQPSAAELEPETAAALESLAQMLADKRAERRAVAPPDRAAAERLDAEIRQLRWQFAGLAAHLQVQQFDQPAESQFDVQAEFEQLLRPLLRALKDVTAGPRQIAELEARLEQVSERRQTAQSARAAVQATLDALPVGSAARAEAERELREHWDPELRELGSQMLVLNANLSRRRQQQQPLLTSVTENVQSFLQNSGLNLVLAALVFVSVYFLLRLLSSWLLRRQSERGFPLRLVEVLAQVLTILIAVAATMVVPYARNDWLLLTVGIVFLVGAGWVIVRMAPQFFEQIRLILNVGAVREGERILVDGLPFRVDALRFYSLLVNPDLTGGALRMPIRDLVDQRSRPTDPSEPWFPCRTGDVVALADGVVGQVQLQTPEVVVVVERHDAPRSYTTASFLEQNPRNLSHGFEVVVTFGIDYRHQAEATTTVPANLRTFIERGLAINADAAAVREVRVELANAGDSSLNYVVLVQFDGSAAVHFHDLDYRVNTLLVAACSEHDYGIPFPQLTVHGSRSTP